MLGHNFHVYNRPRKHCTAMTKWPKSYSLCRHYVIVTRSGEKGGTHLYTFLDRVQGVGHAHSSEGFVLHLGMEASGNFQ